MKNYFMVLGITAAVTLGGFGLTALVDKLAAGSGKATAAPVLIGIVAVLVSLFLGIFLPIRWCSSVKATLLTIFLMPTNYVIPVFIIAALQIVRTGGRILQNLPPNFG